MGWKAERHWERYCGYELSGTRMLIVGVGGVGRIAELASAFGVEVVGHRRSRRSVPPRPSHRRRGRVDDELPATNFLVMIAETPLTRNMIDRRRRQLLPKRAVIINIGRGSTIDEVAMTAMLTDGRLRGAALDVFARSPSKTSAL